MDDFEKMVFYQQCQKLFAEKNASHAEIATATGQPEHEVAKAFQRSTYPKWRGHLVRIPDFNGNIKCLRCDVARPREAYKPDKTKRWGLSPICTECVPLRPPGRPVERSIRDGLVTCTSCRKEKLIKDFYANRTLPGGITHKCKTCTYTRSTPAPEDYTAQMAALLVKLGPTRAREHILIAERKLRILKKLLKEATHG